MADKEIIQALAFSAPAISALICLTMMLFDTFRTDKNRQERQLRFFLSLTYMVAALCWMGLALQTTNHCAFVYYQTVFLFTLMMDQVLIYRFVHIITATEQGCRFFRLHFVFPALFTTVSLVSALVVPFEQRMEVIYGTGEGNAWFAALYLTMDIVFVIYNILYPVLGLLRIRRYRHNIVDYSADAQRSSLNWLSIILILTLITIPVPFAGILLNIDVFNNFWTSMQGVLPTFFVYPILCYNLLSDNYVIIAPSNDNNSPEKPAIAIDPKYFSKYMKEKRPYLNPKLQITDLAAALHTNRSYMSTFINKEYGMNFSRYINCCRMEELDRLRVSPQMKNKTNMDIVLTAGFGSYRSYLRVKSEIDKERVLKAF